MRSENTKLMAVAGIGFMLGALVYRYYINQCFNQSSLHQVNFMLNLFKAMNNESQEALIVRISQLLKVDMFGKRVYDSVTEDPDWTRTSIDLQVYPTGVGAAGAFATCVDIAYGLMVAVVVDKNKQKQSGKKILSLPAGFMQHAIPTDKNFITRQKNMDAFEQAFLRGQNIFSPSGDEILYQADLKRIHTMIRELKEETGLEGNVNSAQRIADQEHIIGNGKKHSLVSFYHISLDIKVNDFNELAQGIRKLHPSNTEEIEAAYLIPINCFSINQEDETFFLIINEQSYQLSPRDTMVMIEGCRRLKSQQNNLNIKEEILNTSIDVTKYIEPIQEIDSITQQSKFK